MKQISIRKPKIFMKCIQIKFKTVKMEIYKLMFFVKHNWYLN